MPRLILAIATTTLASSLGMPTAVARNDPFHMARPSTPFDLNASYCGFPVHVDVLVSRQYFTSETSDDGDEILHVNGSLRYRVTSPTRSIDINASAPYDVIFGVDGSVRILSRGTILHPFTPQQAADTGMPGLALFSGRTNLRFDSIGNAGLVRHGIVRDVCAWLA